MESSATIDFVSSYSFDANGSITGAGTVKVASGTLTLACGAIYNVSGGLSGTDGSATFGAGDTISANISQTGTGTIVFGAGATLASSSTVAISRGTLTFSAGTSDTFASLAMSNGTLSGTDNITVTGAMSMTNGALVSDSGTVTADGGITITPVHGSGQPTLSGGTLENFGTATVSGGGAALEIENGATVVNEPGAEWNQETQELNLFAGTGTFTNEGSFVSTGSTTVTVVFNNTRPPMPPSPRR